MKNSTNIILSLIIPVCCSVAAVTGYHYMSREKTGYVRTGYILSEYEGMKSANSSYEKELQRVQNNMDTLRKRFEYWQEMSQNRGGKDTELRLRDAGNDYQTYSEKAKQQLEQRRMELTSGVIKEINSIVQAYGKKHHYKVILGATDDGSILYGDPEYDITEKILEILNRNFQQEKKSDE